MRAKDVREDQSRLVKTDRLAKYEDESCCLTLSMSPEIALEKSKILYAYKRLKNTMGVFFANLKYLKISRWSRSHL